MIMPDKAIKRRIKLSYCVGFVAITHVCLFFSNGEAMSAASGGLAANGTLMVIGAAGSLRVARNAGHPAAQFPYRCSYLSWNLTKKILQRVMHRIFPTPIPEVRQVTKSDIQSHNLGRSTTHLNKGRSYVTKH